MYAKVLTKIHRMIPDHPRLLDATLKDKIVSSVPHVPDNHHETLKGLLIQEPHCANKPVNTCSPVRLQYEPINAPMKQHLPSIGVIP